MRTMPTGAHIPTLASPQFEQRVASLFFAASGRCMSMAELIEAEKMARHNWTCRIIVEAILGRDLTLAEVEAANAADGTNERIGGKQ